MIVFKTPDEVALMAEASRVVAEVLELLRGQVAPGMTTDDLDRMAEEGIRKRGAIPAFKGYRNYPKTLCASVNEQVVHGIPSKRRLKEGDIIGLDLGAIVSGFYGDSAVTVPVGTASQEALRLIQVTEEAMYQGIAKAVVGNRLSDVSHAIQAHVEKAGFSVVTEFVGHGIGRQLHEEPQVPNYGRPGQGPRLQVGMVLAIEPMVNMGTSAIRILEDRWTAVTQDGCWSAHFEHTIAIQPSGPARILSQLSH
ncbi:type I methionyl aminopeptidase [Nitrospirales bacterium NOB]|nr:MAG: methionyl aminopeptidase [Nitrospira sp. OLB3]MBV6469629.1 Methionine aminopeptidase 1 [Nitrospirota bacterium]MCE7965530.1 type I methionyl aminopeptidase [Nitrospira sp. NTP2]MDL1891080.1 type I methionyl aminopeptidase [Nitrospirales bacterium NOB]MEB2338776.1 type I methionyl aminopeptidase [Nitrospirales bacterium]RIK58783.1 MAG: type I methionyl aminopeptidase [Nitrospira sp.]